MAHAEITRIETAAEKRDERRRVSTMRSMQATLHSLIIEIENICVMGDADRAAAFQRLTTRFEFLGMRSEGLRAESLELANAAEAAEFTEVTIEDILAEG